MASQSPFWAPIGMFTLGPRKNAPESICAPSAANPAQPFSPAEARAAEILQSYGLDFIPAYLGRARAYFAGCLKSPTAEQITSYVIELVNFDQKHREYLEACAHETIEVRLIDWLAATAKDPGIVDLKNILREMVDLERSKLSQARPDLVSTDSSLRLTLNPDKVPKPNTDPCYIGTLKLGTRVFTLRAWIAKGRDFINLELNSHAP